MTMPPRYSDPHALRKALEERLRQQALQSGTALDRLRKEAALQRLLARLAAVAPPESWALKGGLLMLARLSQQARATADADATWRIDQAAVRETLEDAAELDLSDGLEFLVGDPRSLRAEGPEGGLRLPIDARMAGRRFEQLRVDLNLMPGDPRPVEFVELRNLFDMLVIAECLRLPHRTDLAAACRQTFALRHTAWPPQVPTPPVEWAGPWAGFVEDHQIRFTDLPAAFAALQDFWGPALVEGPAFVWDPDSWSWGAAGL